MPDAGATARAGRVRGDQGMTLVEVVVAMAMFSIVLGFVYGLLLTVQKQTAKVSARDDSVSSARLALERMDRQIRSGNVLYDPALETLPLSMRVYTQANGDKKCVQWQVLTTTRVLRTRSWSPSWQTDGQVSAWTVVSRGVQNSTTDPVKPFRLEGGATAYGSRLVNIDLQVRAAGDSAPAVAVRSSLSGRNTLYGYDPGVCSPVPPV